MLEAGPTTILAPKLGVRRQTKCECTVRNGSFPREVCEHFRQMMLANSLALTLKDVGDTRAKIGELLARVNAELARIDAVNDAKSFREAISAQARFLTNSLIEASTKTRWNQGNRLAVESYKVLHLMFIPAIEMSEGMSEGTKKLFIEEISKAMNVAIIPIPETRSGQVVQ